jgi:hypothetical protein
VLDNILAYGSPSNSTEGNSLKKYRNSANGRWGIVAWDSRTKDVVTMYTNDSKTGRNAPDASISDHAAGLVVALS